MTKRLFIFAMLLLAACVKLQAASTNMSLRFDDVSTGTKSSTFTVGDFTIYATSSGTVDVASSNKTIDNVKFTKVLKTGGSRNASYRIIGFHVDGPCKIKTYGVSANSEAERILQISSGSSPLGTVIKTPYCTSQDTPVAEEYEYTGAATNIYIGSYNNGYNIYGIDVTYESDENVLYSLTKGIGSEEVTAGESTKYTLTAKKSLVINGSAVRVKLTPKNGEKFRNGDVLTFSGEIGSDALEYGLNVWASDGETLICEVKTAGTNAAKGCSQALPLSSEQDCIYIGRVAVTKTTMTSLTITRPEGDGNEEGGGEVAPSYPTKGSAVEFDENTRYSELVINSRINDLYGNTSKTGFGVFDDDGKEVTAPANTKSVLDYVPGLVAKAILEAVDYYKDSKEVNVKPWWYAMQYYGNKYDISSNGTAGKSFDDLNAVKLYFKLQELAKAEVFADGDNYTNAATVTTAASRFADALKGIKTANTSYVIGIDKMSGKAAGGWWHKSDYVDQMWCDGQYMGPALLAQMLNEYEGYTPITGSKESDWDLLTKQFTITWEQLWNPTDKLLYHAFTANPSNPISSTWAGVSATEGIYHSAEYWGRAEGWYFLALVDVLEQMQKAGLASTENYKTLHGYLNTLAAGIAARQDKTSGCWYQLLAHGANYHTSTYDNGTEHSDTYNYLESSATAIFTAAYLKGMRLGLYTTDYTDLAKKAYQGIIEKFMVADGTGGVHLVGCCKSAGLGGTSNAAAVTQNKYRDGSAAYYLLGHDVTPTSTKNAADFYTEGKVMGSFIMAATEYERRFLDKRLELTEDIEYAGFAVGDYDEVALTRSFPNNQWATMTVPFSLATEKIDESFGEGTEVAKISSMVGSKLRFIKTAEIKANEPVLIKVATIAADNTYTFRSVTVENPTTETPVQEGNGAQLNGNYTLLTGGQTGDLGASQYFIYNNKFYDCTYMSRMKPFRAYITLPGAADAKQVEFVVDEEETGVKTVEACPQTSAEAYNILGQRVSENARGLIIKKGKKTYNKQR